MIPDRIFYRFPGWAQQAESQAPNFNIEFKMELLTVFFLGTELNGGCVEGARWCPSQTALLSMQML